mmetsp:Transcript_40776/g.66128  ORF Transcript_40776/g.66128 Transcript_40776/m.66128 type:complete len:369 (+) Transcript_40776:181-1287(+)
MEKESIAVPFFIASNVVTAISTIVLNKILLQTFGFHFSISLTCAHFAIATPLLGCLWWLGHFEHKKLGWVQMFPYALLYCGSIVFGNISLDMNSMGFYQLTKILQTPIVGVLEMIFLGQSLTWKEVGALCIVCVGIGCATISEVAANVSGTLIALVSIVVQSTSNILTRTSQKDFDASPMQLLLYQYPLCVLILLCVAPFFDFPEIQTYPYSTAVFGLIILSAVCGFLATICGYMILGKTSALAFSVTGHLKTCIVLVMNYIVFGNALRPRTWVGTFLAMMGMALYSRLRSEHSSSLAIIGSSSGPGDVKEPSTDTSSADHPSSKWALFFFGLVEGSLGSHILRWRTLVGAVMSVGLTVVTVCTMILR